MTEPTIDIADTLAARACVVRNRLAMACSLLQDQRANLNAIQARHISAARTAEICLRLRAHQTGRPAKPVLIACAPVLEPLVVELETYTNTIAEAFGVELETGDFVLPALPGKEVKADDSAS